MRTTQLDADNRPTPKTARYCVRCHRDIGTEQPARRVHLVSGGAEVQHPDEATVASDDMGWHLVGQDCAKRIGWDFTLPE